MCVVEMTVENHRPVRQMQNDMRSWVPLGLARVFHTQQYTERVLE